MFVFFQLFIWISKEHSNGSRTDMTILLRPAIPTPFARPLPSRRERSHNHAGECIYCFSSSRLIYGSGASGVIEGPISSPCCGKATSSPSGGYPSIAHRQREPHPPLSAHTKGWPTSRPGHTSRGVECASTAHTSPRRPTAILAYDPVRRPNPWRGAA